MAIHKFARLIYEAKAIPVFGDGSPARDYTYIDDIIQGILAAIDHPFDFEIFNLGESLSIRLSEVLRLLEEVSGRKPKIQNFPAQPGDVNLTYADISKARRMLDYQLRTRFEEGLSEFVRWFERNSIQLDLQVNR